MATRKIATEFEITGEQKYKNALSEINSSLRVLSTEMDKVSAEYEGNDKSLAALNAKYDVLNRQLLTQHDKVNTLRDALQEAAGAYGEADTRTMKWQTQLNSAEAALLKMEHKSEDMRAQIDALSTAEEEAADVTEEFGETAETVADKTVGLGDAAEELGQKLGVNLPDGAKNALNSLGKIDVKVLATAGIIAGLAVAAKKAADALAGMTKESAARADELLTQTSTTGVATDALQKFKYAENLVDVQADTLADSLKDLTKNMADAAHGNEEYAARFDALGVSITNTDGSLRDSYDVFLDVIDALGEMGNRTERDAAAMGLINESAQRLNPLIDSGTESLRAYGDEAERLGYVLSEDDLEALHAVDDAQQKLLKTQEAVTNQIAVQYAPHMEKALTKSSELVQRLGKTVTDSRVVDNFGSLVDFTVELFDPLMDIAEVAIPALSVALNSLSGLVAWFLDAADVLNGLLHLDFNKIGVALGYGMNTTGEMSHLQQWKYGTSSAGDRGWVQDANGQWVANGYNAGGTDNWRGGWTTVGEAGPELVSLPRGARVMTAQESREVGGDTFVFNIDAKNVRELNQLVAMAENFRRDARMRG